MEQEMIDKELAEGIRESLKFWTGYTVTITRKETGEKRTLGPILSWFKEDPVDSGNFSWEMKKMDPGDLSLFSEAVMMSDCERFGNNKKKEYFEYPTENECGDCRRKRPCKAAQKWMKKLRTGN